MRTPQVVHSYNTCPKEIFISDKLFGMYDLKNKSSMKIAPNGIKCIVKK